MIEIVERCHESHPQIDEMFSDFCNDAEAEWFESPEDLQEFYFRPKNWNTLFSHGFSKAEFKYNSLLILERKLYSNLLELMHEILKRHEPSIDVKLLFLLMREMSLHPDSFINESLEEEKSIPIPYHLAKYVLNLGIVETEHQNEEIILKLSKPTAEQERVKSQLFKYNYSKNRLFAVEKTLGAISDAFIYQTSVASPQHAGSNLVSSS
jgi:hypothetical protein